MNRGKRKPAHIGLLLLALAALSVVPLRAQSASTAAQPDQGYGPVDTSAPSIPPEKIIQEFAAKESEFRAALNNYTYQRDVTIQTIDEDGKVDGEYRQVVSISFDSTGRKVERVTFAPANTLERISMSPSDMSDIEHRLPFVLTSEDIGQYNLKYVGRQKVDEVDTYIFDVAPKAIEKNHRYFQGRIWVDQKDLQIVITSGKNVPDDTRKGHEDLSPPFTTYREQVDGKYWFPVYTKADAVLHFSGGNGYMGQDVRIREICRYTDYKQFRSTVKLIFQGQDVTNNTPPGGQQPPASGTAQTPSEGTSASPR
ncbi:MAG TPA: hypothetical protein VGR96_04890 [Acidobacteriaceae bacterium]|nr:hypothetical protein [Acidobacteriaceae bacterium]